MDKFKVGNPVTILAHGAFKDTGFYRNAAGRHGFVTGVTDLFYEVWERPEQEGNYLGFFIEKELKQNKEVRMAETPKFKVGDKIKLTDYTKYEFPRHKNEVAVITRVNGGILCQWPDGNTSILSVNGPACFGAYKINEGETKMGRRTFRLEKETADLKKGALVQEACDDGHQEYVLLENQEKFVKYDDLSEYDISITFSRKSVEENSKFFTEVFAVEPAFMDKEQLARHKEFMAKPARKKVVRK